MSTVSRRPLISSGALRATYAVAGVALIVVAIRMGGVATWQFWVFVAAPDITFLYGIGPGLEHGQLHPRAVPYYNAAHRLVGPVALALGSLLVGRPWLIAALAWAAHICIDRALGFGLRTKEGFQRRPLGPRAID